MKKAHYDNTNGKILGFYDTDIHKVIPTPNIEISLEAWQNAINNAHNKINSDGTSELFDFSSAVDKAKVRISEIDARLSEIDIESLRPLRAINNNRGTTFDVGKLLSLDDEAEALRVERASLAI